MDGYAQFFKKMDFCVYIFILALAWDFLKAEEAHAGSHSMVFVPIAQPLPAMLSCPENEYFRYCLANCTNCEDRGKCPIDCSQTGCDCMLNFVRLEPGGKCEPVAKCPKPKCGENESFRACGPICETCSTLKCHVISCEYKCYCKEGYLRGRDGKCIPEDECPKRNCTRSEEKRPSGPVDENCLHSESQVVSNSTQEKEQCYCKFGLKRNTMGYCIHENICEFVACLNGEEYQTCPKKCNTTCRNYGDPACEEDGYCYPGCFCPEGLYMNDNHRCVPLEKCPPGSNPLAPTPVPTTLTDAPSSTAIPSTSTLEVMCTTTEEVTQSETLGEEDVPTDEDTATQVDDEEETDVEEETTTKAAITTTTPKPWKTGRGGKTVRVKAQAQSQKTAHEKSTPTLTTSSSPDVENE